MTALDVQSVRLRYGAATAVEDASLTVEPGELHAIVGQSGAGKTSLLRAVAGFERIAAGAITIGGVRVDDGVAFVPPERRCVGVVFQEYALFPHLTVGQNVAFGMRGPSMLAVAERLAEVGLAGFEHRVPGELSGGEQQRVALARALACSPKLLLLDEPFAHLDPSRREALRSATRRVIRDHGIAALMVTHDAADALSMADRVHVMHRTRILQSASPVACYTEPVDATVAAALGVLQTLPCVTAGPQHVECLLGRVRLRTPIPAGTTGGHVLLRPEMLVLHPGSATVGQPARVIDRQLRGSDLDIHVRMAAGVELVARVRPWQAPEGEQVRVEVGQPCAWLADAQPDVDPTDA
jgi:iron(III) transport system ATP-binding protein